eukprot:15990333-Heterocapsa_arctica.AAC.1
MTPLLVNKQPSNASTYLASPASSVVGEENDSDIAPWEAFDEECNWETEYCDSRVMSNPPSLGSDEIIPAMPCTQLAHNIYPINASVACPVPKSDIAKSPGARVALDIELKRLRDKS